jgi:hypothetical protein
VLLPLEPLCQPLCIFKNGIQYCYFHLISLNISNTALHLFKYLPSVSLYG